MARRKQQRTAQQSRVAEQSLRQRGISPGIVVGIVVGALALAALGVALTRGGATSAPATSAATATVPAVAAAPISTEGCRTLPSFTANPELGLTGGLAVATDQPQMGLVLLSTDRPGEPFQHETWDDAGFLGPIAYDRSGNIYAAPTPRVSLVDNPLEGMTTLWRVDSASGEMRSFVTLPGAANERNPYGILGLTYVCDLDRLYAGTVIGSTPTTEQGGVVAIGADGIAQSTVLANTDVMGVLVVRTGVGYELYAGLARSPEIIALPLDAQGEPAGPAHTLIDLTAAGATPSERARKLRLINGELVVDLVPFNFSLQTSAAGQQVNRQAAWAFDTANGTWVVSRRAAGPGQ